jgi:hypothetical protein
MTKIGSQVTALISTNNKEVLVLGRGVYVGDFEPPEGIPGLKSPKIVLDNGDVVWGCECWWAETEIIDAMVKKHQDNGAQVKNVNIKDYR